MTRQRQSEIEASISAITSIIQTTLLQVGLIVLLIFAISHLALREYRNFRDVYPAKTIAAPAILCSEG